jgi:hypothetical protein
MRSVQPWRSKIISWIAAKVLVKLSSLAHCGLSDALGEPPSPPQLPSPSATASSKTLRNAAPSFSVMLASSVWCVLLDVRNQSGHWLERRRRDNDFGQQKS